MKKFLKKLIIPLVFVLGLVKLILDLLAKGSLENIDKVRDKDSQLAEDIANTQKEASNKVGEADDLKNQRENVKVDSDWDL